MKTWFLGLLSALGLGVAVMSGRAPALIATGGEPVETPRRKEAAVTSGGEGWNGARVRNAAVHTVEMWFPSVSPLMVQGIARNESNYDQKAYRAEPHLNDASYGMMQTLLSTAQWLARDMGYRSFGVPEAKDLFVAEISLYFGTAYLHYLKNYKGKPRSDEWVVRAYNGGPGWEQSDKGRSLTLTYWNRYLVAKKQVMENPNA